MINVLYIHGMGGGGDSRIPALLNSSLNGRGVEVIVRTYDFDPEAASVQIGEWIDELQPALVIGESLGSIHTLRIKGIPHILISPSLNAPLFLGYLSWLALIPGVPALLGHIYKPREGDRQTLSFRFRILRKYVSHRKAALRNSSKAGNCDMFFAFFGTRDHYRKSGIVSVRAWRRHFGDTYMMYDGTHFTEEEHIFGLVLPYIMKCLGINE